MEERAELSYRLATENEYYGFEGYNLKPYVAYCQYCKYQVTTILAGVKCVKCDSYLINLIVHNDLARSNS